MKSILETLYNEYATKKELYPEKETRISCNEKELKASLAPHERKLLLRIQDDSSLIAEKTGADGFTHGVRAGIRLMLEILYLGDDQPDLR